MSRNKLIFASTEEVSLQRDRVATVLYACAIAMGFDTPGNFDPFVSDLSAISDFCMGMTEYGKDEFFERVSRELGIVVERDACMILDVAKRLLK